MANQAKLLDDRRNCYFQDGNAYTEDDVLVYNIFIRNCPKGTNEMFRNYFTKFGEVLEYNRWGGRSRDRKGTVRFLNPIAAASALRDIHPDIQVEACHSWRQPAIESAENPAKKRKISLSENTAASVLSLNDECLQNICEYLKLPDKMYLALAHPGFAAIVELYYKHQYKHFDITELETMTLWQIREFSRIFQPYIEKVSGKLPFLKQKIKLDLLGMRYWRNLTSIDFFESQIYKNTLLTIAQPRITQLRLDQCTFYNQDIGVAALSNLRMLSITSTTNLAGRFLNFIPNVQHLDFSCTSFDINCFIEALKSTEFLKSINIYDTQGGYNDLKRIQYLNALVDYKSEQLEYLKWGRCSKKELMNNGSRLVGSMTQLKRLQYIDIESLTDNCLRQFGRLKFLEQLEINNFCEITSDGLLQLLRECTKLKKFNIDAKYITTAFIHQAIGVLKATPERNGPLVIPVNNASSLADKTILEDAQYIEAASLLQLSYQIESIGKFEPLP